MSKHRNTRDQKGDGRKSDDLRREEAPVLPPYDTLVRRRRIYTFLMWLLAVLALFFAWAAFGMMMRIGFLPVFDLGYSWFDSHVFVFFGVLAH